MCHQPRQGLLFSPVPAPCRGCWGYLQLPNFRGQACTSMGKSSRCMGHSAWMVSLQDRAQGLLRDRPGPCAMASCSHQQWPGPQGAHQAPSCAEDTSGTVSTQPHGPSSPSPAQCSGEICHPRAPVCLCAVNRAPGARGAHGPRWKAEGKGSRGLQGTGLVVWKELRAGRLFPVSQNHEATRAQHPLSMWDSSSHLPWLLPRWQHCRGCCRQVQNCTPWGCLGPAGQPVLPKSPKSLSGSSFVREAQP